MVEITEASILEYLDGAATVAKREKSSDDIFPDRRRISLKMGRLARNRL
jgi:hypothetical protein